MNAAPASGLWNAVDATVATAGRSRRFWQAEGVSIDSRTLAPGDLFVPLVTEQRDGHEFVAAALQKGAAAAIVSKMPPGVAEDAPLLIVDDSMQALERLGAFARERSLAKRVAITGSVGKTGTKEALKACLSPLGATHASAASYNNQWGVPLTLARMPQNTAFGVFEIGMNHAGEIAALSPQVLPDVAVITTIAPAHLAHFRSTEEIALAKAEIFLGTQPGGVAVIHGEAPHAELLVRQARERELEVVTFGRSSEHRCRLLRREVLAQGSMVTASFDNIEYRYKLGPSGEHWVANSLAVLASLCCLDVPVHDALGQLSELRPGAGRGATRPISWQSGTITLIDDSYNANPTSMLAAIEVLGQADSRRVAILGDMLELGASGPAMHADLATAIEDARIDLVLTCGPLMAFLSSALPGSRRGAHAADAQNLIETLASSLQPGDTVLIKGSLGSKMGSIVEHLQAQASCRNGEPV